MKTFKYTKIIDRVYLKGSDEYEEVGADFDYEVNDDKLLGAVVELLIKEDRFSKGEENNLHNFIKEFDLLITLVEQYEEELKDMFEVEAMKS